MMKRADRKGGFFNSIFCVSWSAGRQHFLSLGKSGHRRAQVNHCLSPYLYRHRGQSQESILVPLAGFHFQHWFFGWSTCHWAQKTLHISCTNAVIGVCAVLIRCVLLVCSESDTAWFCRVVDLGWLPCTEMSKKLHPRLCWNHDFSLCHMRLGEFLAQHAFTMLDHKHGRVATLFLPFRCDNLMKAAFR